MKLYPYLHAFAALAYIMLLALFMRFIESIRHDTPDTFIDGIGFLSLFVFSAVVMAFLFFYQPIKLLIEHKPREASTFFLTTLASFGVAVAILLVLVSLQ